MMGLGETNETQRPAGRRSADAAERSCIVTRRAMPRDALVRFVIGPDEHIVPDVGERLPGRGLWVSATREAVDTACKRNAFAKAARRSVAIAPGLSDEVERQLAARALGLLGLARRGSAIAVGHDKVRALLGAVRAAVLIEASDAAVDSSARMTARAGSIPVVSCFDRRELGLALGREEAVHVALETGPMAAHFLAAVERLKGFRHATANGPSAATNDD
jgi:predicted RNA-binding protein YlxR (DUF448 family)